MGAWRRFKVSKGPNDVDHCVRDLVRWAPRCSRHYQALFRASGVETGTIRGVADLNRIPLTCKRDLHADEESPSELRPRRRPTRIGTSGTAGQVLLIPMSQPEAAFRSYLFYRAMRRNARLTIPFSLVEVGVGPYVGARPKSAIERTPIVRLDRISRLLPIDEQAQRLRASGAQVVTGHASCLEMVAEALIRQGVRVKARLVVSRGEILTPRVRQLLVTAFDAKVADYYNCEEVGNIAWECPADSAKMHLNTDGCVVEILDDTGVCASAEGRVVVTGLYNWTMPFVRYDLGDRAAFVPRSDVHCACGSRAPVIRPPAGRADDYFLFGSDRRLSPRTVECLVVPPFLRLLMERGSRNRRGTPPYRIIQEDETRIRVLVAGGADVKSMLEEEIVKGFAQLGLHVSAKVEVVDALPPTASAKRETIVSRVSRTRAAEPPR